MYLDANNLYLPYSGFKWLNRGEVDNFDVNSIEDNSPIAYLEYPDELHELHNDYPLAPVKLKISHNLLSNYCSSIGNKYGKKIGGVDKLVTNLRNKSKYVLHSRNPRLYLPWN